jgi:hypothetical protein
MKNYTLITCENLIDKYLNEYQGAMTTVEEGCLGLGVVLLHDAEGKKFIVIKEVFQNEWSSTHTIRMYNKTPKKYQEFIN